ncbi:hypothetical protein HYT05_03665 [Candidatus Kaiserbacteria bacterium]|nr:hypothetical protein [Candidatus Kaiserbacteria bacterium]
MNILRKHTIVLVLLAILVSMTIGGTLSYMAMMEDGSMHNCPYMGVTALCDMTPLTHLSEWQSMFASVAQQFSIFIFLLLIALFVASYLATDLFVSIESPPGVVVRYRKKEIIIDHLRLAFARGLIHPKVF